MTDSKEANPAAARGIAMLKTIKARCVNGALHPLEPVELHESGEYLVTVDIAPPLSDAESRHLLRSVAGSWQKDGAYWEQALQAIYEARRLGSRVPPER